MRPASLFAILILLAAGAAAARSRHEAPSVKPITSGGRAVGFKLKLKLINHDGYAIGAVGLIPRDKATTGLTRAQAISKSQGVLRHQFAPVTLARGEAREVEFEVHYGQDNDLKPGELLSVISAWASRLEDTNPHVWGAASQNGGPEHHIELPQ